MTVGMVDELYNFSKNSGGILIYDLNLALFNGSKWDSTNARTLLNYTSSRGYRMDFQLGNEPENYGQFNINMSGQQVADAYADCRTLLNTYDLYKNSFLVGPEVTVPMRNNMLADFVSNGGANYVNALTFHHYYFCGTNLTVDAYTNVKTMDSLQDWLNEIKNITTTHSNYTGPIWLSETATNWCGTAANLSGAFVDGFMWLDKIGLSARNRINAVIREGIYGGDLGLLVHLNDSFSARPDYWVLFLYKKLVGTKIFNVSADVEDKNLRLYGASSKNTDGFIVYGINVANYSQSINFPQITNSQVIINILEESEPGNLLSKSLKLNDVVLEWYSHEPIANIQGYVTTLPIGIPPYSQFFIQAGQSKVQQCLNGWYQETTNAKKCIKILSDFQQPWFGANFDCTTFGANASALSIESAFENSEINRFLSNSTCTQFYIGLYKNQDNWVWSNGDTSGYRNWQSGFPTNDDTQKCAIVDTKTETWSNSDCNFNQCYVCQNYIS